jgi:hypothetical protein
MQLLVESSQMSNLVNVNEVKVGEEVQPDGVITTKIPPDQWITEVEGMESFVWASLQVSIADYAIGVSVRSPDLAEYVVKPTSVGDKELCASQKMRKAGGFV